MAGDIGEPVHPGAMFTVVAVRCVSGYIIFVSDTYVPQAVSCMTNFDATKGNIASRDYDTFQNFQQLQVPPAIVFIPEPTIKLPSFSPLTHPLFPKWQPEQFPRKSLPISPLAYSATNITPSPLTIPVADTNINHFLFRDAETAIQNAPFIDLGRHALAQNWSCVRVGNVCIVPVAFGVANVG